jgi:hypothetical protein
LLSVILRWEVCLLILMEFLTIMTYRLSFYDHISHIIVKYKKYHWLNIFMSCKLQHGKIEIIWYLQKSKACQVVECACWDGCNLIRRQITAKYKIRTKYNDNLRPNKDKESRKKTFVLPEPTYRRTKHKNRKNKRQTMVHIRKLKFKQQ